MPARSDTRTHTQMLTFHYLLHRTYVFEKLVVKRTFYRCVCARVSVRVCVCACYRYVCTRTCTCMCVRMRVSMHVGMSMHVSAEQAPR